MGQDRQMWRRSDGVCRRTRRAYSMMISFLNTEMEVENTSLFHHYSKKCLNLPLNDTSEKNLSTLELSRFSTTRLLISWEAIFPFV